MDSSPKSSLKLEVPYSEKISRLFIFRPLWVCLLIWPLGVLACWMYIVLLLQFVYMLFLGKRHLGLFNQSVRFFSWMTQWQSYMGNYTDMRPGLWW